MNQMRFAIKQLVLSAVTASCLELGLGFELDIRTTKNGKFVVLHDATLERTTDGPGRTLTEFTWDQLREFDAGSWFDPRFLGLIHAPAFQDRNKKNHSKTKIEKSPFQ